MNTRAKQGLDILIINVINLLEVYNMMNPEFQLTLEEFINHLKQQKS